MTRKQILDKALNRILKYPGKFDMRSFKTQVNKYWKEVDPTYEALDCGTVCCFAGEIVIAKDGHKGFGATEYHNMGARASQILGLLHLGEQGSLFYPGSNIFEEAGLDDHLPGTPAYAKCAVKAIRKYFKTYPLVEAEAA